MLGPCYFWLHHKAFSVLWHLRSRALVTTVCLHLLLPPYASTGQVIVDTWINDLWSQSLCLQLCLDLVLIYEKDKDRNKISMSKHWEETWYSYSCSSLCFTHLQPFSPFKFLLLHKERSKTLFKESNFQDLCRFEVVWIYTLNNFF